MYNKVYWLFINRLPVLRHRSCFPIYCFSLATQSPATSVTSSKEKNNKLNECAKIFEKIYHFNKGKPCHGEKAGNSAFPMWENIEMSLDMLFFLNKNKI